MPIYSELKGKKALITGVGSGIGYAQLRALLRQGTICYGIDQQFTPETKALEAEFLEQVYLYNCDLADDEQLQATIQKIQTTAGTIDFLLNTAGILDGYQPTLETTLENWDKFMAVDLRSQFQLTNAFLPAMVAKKSGKILNMASIAGLVAGGGGAVYTAAKHAVIGYTKQLDYDYAKVGIQANCLAPGAIDTPMNAADFAGEGTMAKSVAAQTPARRWGHAEEVALVSLFMLSDGADFIHGAVIPIDGGWIEQ
ncbi:3-oxoacyl-ACP reductase [Agrilactobacillus yilanensis]|uniref:3-oxoacyl-ACP reductase n=1 Tax=Agrilactobacillus yilanensis TaxID=2485997 RepID=A0ABW4J6C7_9LACO|nr:3-oxoacyl-ACP reductase [Agrilactobacillus yilanensis]